jgi:hypothetical protein
MPKLSLWKEQKSNDYRFLDRTISEMFTVGATDLYIHKYIGVNNPSNSKDLTQPFYDKTDPTNLQDLLFLENRDKKYDTNIYRLRGHYNVQNLDFDLSQFGLFLTSDIIFVTVHYNDMIDVIGRKLMVGDVFELPHLTDYHPLNDTLPIGLRRYYQITDANFASEGFSSTWWPHLWRIKCEPLTDSQEFADILNKPIKTDNYLGDYDPTKTYNLGYTVTFGDKIYTPTQPVPAGTDPSNSSYWVLSTEQNLRDIVSRYKKNIEINDAVLEEAKRLLPKSGYDTTSQLYVLPTLENNEPAPPVDVVIKKSDTPSPIITVNTVASTKYQTKPTVLIIPKDTVYLGPGTPAILEQIIVPVQYTDTGSGPVSRDTGLLVTPIITYPQSGPYGTSDNTYSTSDQYVSFIITANATPKGSFDIILVDIPNFLQTGLVIQGTVYNQNGNSTSVFSNNTVIIAINPLTKNITVSNKTLGDIPTGQAIEVNYNFDGEINDNMDYLADCDPRYQYIRRQTPRSFGYLAGYLTGDDSAPNGEPVGHGIAFPANSKIGDYFLRLDYLPQKLFRFNGKMWVEISRNVRTPTGFTDEDQSLVSTFINNDNTVNSNQGQIPSRQSLSNFLKIKPD